MSNHYIPPGTTFTGRNECDVLTILTMGVQCFSTDIVSKNDGIIELVITGGTQPYTIYWTDNTQLSGVSYGNYIRYDLSAGTYTAIVTDRYGDFVESITCSVNSPTPTPSQTPRPTPTPIIQPITCSNYCFRLIPKPEASCGTLAEIYLQFSSTTSDLQGNMVWVCTTTTTNPATAGVNFNGYTIKKDTTSNLWRVYNTFDESELFQINPPLPGCTTTNVPTQVFQMYAQGGSQPFVNWTLDYSAVNPNPKVGVFASVYDLSVTCKLCPTFTIKIRVSVTQPPCEGSGIITILPQGGTGAYSYTINANDGTEAIYQLSNIFYGLTPGTYYVMVKDSLGNTSNIEVIVINYPPPPQNYNLTISTTALGTSVVSLAPPGATYSRYRVQKSFNFNITITPSLSLGQSITFNINHNVSSNIKPFIWVSQNPIQYDNPYRMGYTSNVVNVYKNSVLVPKTVNLTPQIYTTATTPVSPFVRECLDTFDLNDSGNRKTSVNFLSSPNVLSYVNFNSGGTNVWNVTIFNNGTPDVISGTVVSYVEESTFGTVSPTYLNWTTSAQTPHNFLRCETLNTIDTITISDISIGLDNCSNIDNNAFFTVTTNITSARDPFGAK